ncbi:hypothetical protein BD324DRAFT_639989 [Kockovaella imperatae]|uniref:Uncharacterized protein n=1 Tax=Kockovaella imperatae TaxID=4999 RepID=A0A1Y1U5T2_9TREE|nr:hypothetical protein BD324DRAFT_639989 [Kockovaella imperatae]ORX33401.1 hypothetical protein BD324DRAFT_639989 [Kockovaella imperatae]
MTSWLRYTENHTSQSKRKSTLSDRNLQHQSPHSLSPPSLPHSPHVQTPYLDPWLASVPDHLTEVVFAQSTPLPCSWTPGRPQYPPEILSPTPRRYIMDQLNPLGNSWRSDEYSLKGKEKEERWNMVPSMRQTHSGLPDDSTRLEPSTGPWDAPKRAFTHDKAHGSSGSRGPGSIRIGPLPSAILASIMDTSAGRDKVLKTIQYTLKTYLYLLSLIARVRPLSIWFKANSKRMKIATGSLSLTR